MRRVFLITVDGWGTNLVAAYGNALCETPNLDRFASRSTVFDRCWTSSLQLTEIFRSILGGRHPLARNQVENGCLPEVLASKGMRSIFLSDDTSLAEEEWLAGFDEVRIYPTQSAVEDGDSLPNHWTETSLAHFIEMALGDLTTLSEESSGLPEFVWLHLSGLTQRWDAPYEYRQRLCNLETDPEPSRSAEPITLEVDETTDPDSIFQATCVASAQGIVIDDLFEWFETSIEQLMSKEECLAIVMGTRAYPLGEHRSVGFARHSPYTEAVHVPLIVRCGLPEIGSRDPRMIQPMTLYSTILTWLSHESVASFDESTADYEVPLVMSANAVAIQAPRWSMVATLESLDKPTDQRDARQLGLYLSPDDRWQQNNVASRVEDVSDSMLELAQAWRTWLESGAHEKDRPLAAECLARPV